MIDPPFATVGSQRWLQVAVAQYPELLDSALRESAAIDPDDSVVWKSPLSSERFTEYRDGAVLRCLEVDHLPNRQLAAFWPNGGPVWDALGRTRHGHLVFVEAKAHIAEAASPPCRASEMALKLIRKSLEEARKHYSPRSKVDWSQTLYQYANRLAFQYFFRKLNGLPSKLVFLNFCNAPDVDGPESEAEWHGATRLIHALLGLPYDLTKHGVHHAFLDVRPLVVKAPPLPEEPIDVQGGIRQSVLARWHASDSRRDHERLDRYRGCLVGGAVGDALGAPVEFMSQKEIVTTHGPGGVQDYAVAFGRLGAITDDTQMTMFTADGLLRSWVRFSMKGIGPAFSSVTDRAYGRWMKTQGERPGFSQTYDSEGMGWLIGHKELFHQRAPGMTCLSAMRDKTRAGDAAENSSKGCGGVMRVAPVGLLSAAVKPGQDAAGRDRITFQLGCEIAGLTHGHPTGQHPAGYLSVLISVLVDGEPWQIAYERARRALGNAPSSEETAAIVDLAIRLAAQQPNDANAINELGAGWVAEEALAISLYCAASALSEPRPGSDAFERSVILAVNHDGDSDSTGAITGNIVGAALGQKSIPERWQQQLELAQAIREMGDDLATSPVWNIDAYETSIESDYWLARYPGG